MAWRPPRNDFYSLQSSPEGCSGESGCSCSVTRRAQTSWEELDWPEQAAVGDQIRVARRNGSVAVVPVVASGGDEGPSESLPHRERLQWVGGECRMWACCSSLHGADGRRVSIFGRSLYRAHTSFWPNDQAPFSYWFGTMVTIVQRSLLKGA